MATVIDALVVTLGLDPRDFTKGQKQVAQGLIDTSAQAGKTSRDIESSGKRAASYISSVKNEVVGLFLAFAGAKTLTDFAGGMIDNAAAAGRLSANIGVSTERIGAWQGAVKEMNGTAQEANDTLSAMSTAISNYQLTRSTGNDAAFRALGVNLSDLQAGPEAMLMKIAQAGETMNRRNYVNLLQRLGFGPGMIATLEQGRGKLEQVLSAQERMYAITRQDAEAAQQFQKALADIGRTIQGDAAPYLMKLVVVLDQFSASKGNVQAAGDVIAGTLAAIGLAAAAAYWPVAALAAAIAIALKAKQDWDKGDPWFSLHNDGGAAAAKKAKDPKDPYGKGLLGGLEAMWNSDWFSVYHKDAGASGAGGPVGPVSKDRLTNIIGSLVARGIDPGTARGIGAGIMAEGGSWHATNSRSGAYGIGQWLGPRKAAMFAKYGPNPTPSQQYDFLVGELRGGDRGGSSVLGAKDSQTALMAYIWNFMRPQGARGEHMADARADYGRGLRYLRGNSGSGITFNGPVTITTQAKDAKGLADQLPPAARRRALATPANSGLN